MYRVNEGNKKSMNENKQAAMIGEAKYRALESSEGQCRDKGWYRRSKYLVCTLVTQNRSTIRSRQSIITCPLVRFSCCVYCVFRSRAFVVCNYFLRTRKSVTVVHIRILAVRMHSSYSLLTTYYSSSSTIRIVILISSIRGDMLSYAALASALPHFPGRDEGTSYPKTILLLCILDTQPLY